MDIDPIRPALNAALEAALLSSRSRHLDSVQYGTTEEPPLPETLVIFEIPEDEAARCVRNEIQRKGRRRRNFPA